MPKENKTRLDKAPETKPSSEGTSSSSSHLLESTQVGPDGKKITGNVTSPNPERAAFIDMLNRVAADTIRGRPESQNVFADPTAPYLTSRGRRFAGVDLKGRVRVLSPLEEMQKLANIGIKNIIAPPTDAYNSLGYVFLKGRSALSKQAAEILIQDNFEHPTTYQIRDPLIYRDPQSGELTHGGIVTEVSPDGKEVLEIASQILVGGSVVPHHPDKVKRTFGNYEILREREGASTRPANDYLVPGEPHVTSKRNSIPVFHPKKDFPTLSPELAKQQLEIGGYSSNEMEMIEPPNPRRNCFGYVLLKDGNGWINDPLEVVKVINDDLSPTEIAHVDDPIVYRCSSGLSPHMGFVHELSPHMGFVHELSPDGKVLKVRSVEAESGTYLHDPDLLIDKYGKWELHYKKTSVDSDFKREEEQYNAYKRFIDHAIENPKTITKESKLTPAKLAVCMMVADQFRKVTELSIQKANESTMYNAQKYLDLFRTRIGELSVIVKQLQGEKIEGQSGHSEIHQLTPLEGAEQEKKLWERYESLEIKRATYDFENNLIRTLLENNGIIPKDAQERKRRKKEASRIRKNAVEAMVNGKEQVNALDRFDNFVQRQEHTRDNLLQTLNVWAKSLQSKVTESTWSDDFKEKTREYLATLEKFLTPERKGAAKFFLYDLFEQTSGVLETLAKTDTNQAT